MKLPAEFIERMKERLGNAFPAFLQAYENAVCRGIRVNPLKISREGFLKIAPFTLSPVPWEENGFYIAEEKAGGDVYHFAGLYYCQEPSAMCAAPLLDVTAGERVLDLCAAPGGKTTQLAAALNGRGVLVANEYVSSRAKILAENVERLGVINCAVTNADTGRLAAELPCFFDKILVDAPCSGEGMFKKEEAAVREWSTETVLRCAERQKEILENAAAMLAPEGRLVYSTCTFSQEENEGQIADFLHRHREFALIETRTLYPHEVRGEGHFAAVLEKREGKRRGARPFPVRRDGAALRAYKAFAADFFADGRGVEGEITVLPDGRMFLLPEGLPALSSRLLRAGLPLGEWDGRSFKPSHALAVCMRKEASARFVALSRGESEAYLRGETLSVQGENGWCVVGVGEYSLGLGKIVNGTLKNHYPKGLRKVK